MPSDCVHGYKDLAVRFREPDQRAAAEAALAADGVMTKRYFFPVHRMDVYRKFARRVLPVTDRLHERLFASRSTTTCPMSASTPLHNSSAPAQFGFIRK